MTDNSIIMAVIVLAAFVAVWFIFIAPAERRHNKRKLEIVRKRIEEHEKAVAERRVVAATDSKSTDRSQED
jgi:membrane protein YdbS with pleckstrin-like domain